jgi:predicted  nucleic acid-binding Zn-ribbon protein
LAVRQIETELRALDPDIQELDRALHALEMALQVARDGVLEADKRRAELEGRIESYRVMQERRRQRLEWVKGAKEASTLMAELDLARSVLAKEEAEWMRSASAVQDAEKRVAEAQKVVDEVRETQAPRRAEIAEQAAEHAKRLEQARARRDDAAVGVPEKLLTVYERVLRGRAPQALYPLRGSACGHCFTTIPLHKRQDIRNGESFEPCEACGVLVYVEEGTA